MTPAARATELVCTYGLKPDALVVHAGGGGSDLLRELRRLGCRVLALDLVGLMSDAGIDTIRAALTPAAARLVRARYGSVALLIASSDVSPVATSICLSPDGMVVAARDQSGTNGCARAA